MKVYVDGYNVKKVGHGFPLADRAFIVSIYPDGTHGVFQYDFLVFADNEADAIHRLKVNCIFTIQVLSDVDRGHQADRLTMTIRAIDEGNCIVKELSRNRAYAVSYFDDTRSYTL